MNVVAVALLALLTNGPGPTWSWTFDGPDGSGGSPLRLEPDADLTNDTACGGRSLVTSQMAGAGVDLGVAPGQLGTRDFTASLWFRTETRNYNNEVLSNRATGSHGNFFNLRFTNSDAYGHGAIVFELDEHGHNYSVLTSPPGLNDGAWHQVIARRAGTELTLFIDGVVVVRQQDRGIADIRNGVPLYVGTSPVAGEYGLFFDGVIDDVRITHTAISNAEAKKLARKGCAGGRRS